MRVLTKSCSFFYTLARMASCSCCLSICPYAIPSALAPSIFLTEKATEQLLSYVAITVSFIQGRDVQFQEELSNISMLAKLQDFRMVIPTSYLN